MLCSASVRSFGAVDRKQFYVTMSRARRSMHLYGQTAHGGDPDAVFLVKTERFSRTEGKTPAFIDGEVHKLLDAVVFHTSVGNPKAGNRRLPEFPGSSQETVSRLPSCYGEPMVPVTPSFFSSPHFSPSQHTTPPKGGLHFRLQTSLI